MIVTTRPSSPSCHRRPFVRLALVLLLTSVSLTGCTREFFRNWADQDVTEAVFEKSRDPRFRLDMFTITPPALSRFADPYDPDRPPAPPDDYAAQNLSPVPQWPHHRLLTPAEGTGYMDVLEKWRRESPPRSLVDVSPDTGPSAAPRSELPPPSEIPSPFLPGSSFPGTEPPGMTPLPYGDPEEIAPDVPPRRVPGFDLDVDIDPAQSHSETSSKAPSRDPVVQTASFQIPELDDEAALGMPSTADPGPGRLSQDLLRPDELEVLDQLNVSPSDIIGGEELEPMIEPERDLIDILRPEAVAFDEAFAAGLGPDIEPYVVNPQQVLTLALQNSRAYQFRMESIYLAGLAVTLARFQFEPQFYAGLNPSISPPGGFPNPNPGNSFNYRTQEAPGGQQSLLNLGTAAGFGKLFSTGLAVAGGFANQTVFNFIGSNPSQPTVTSFLPLSVTQPFLRNGGRARVLEPLTQAERNLLYEVREFARFRQEFFVSILTGQGITGGGPGDPAIGFLQVLSNQLQLENTYNNVAAYERVIEVFQQLGVGPGSTVSPIDLITVENTLQGQRRTLYTAVFQYRNLLDNFKMQLGLPPDIPLLPNADLISGFREIFSRLDALPDKRRSALESLVQEVPQLEDVQIGGESVIEPIRQAFQIDSRRSLVEQRIVEREALRRELLRQIDILGDALRVQMAEPDSDPQQLDFYRQELERVQASLNNLSPELDEQDREVVSQLREARARYDRQTTEELGPLLLSAQRVALENRLDLMNARAQLYDAWRQLAFTANQLKGVFNVSLSHQIITPPTTTNPFGFDSQSQQISLSFNSELPLIRVAERNSYITAQINYQRARRLLQQQEDQVKFQIRQLVRNLQLQYQQYEINKVAYVVSLIQQDQTFQSYLEPPRPGAGAGRQNVVVLVQALNSVPQSQNALITSWVAYQTQRLALYRDLGIMPYDEWEAFYELFAATGAAGSSSNRDATGGPPFNPAGIPNAGPEAFPWAP